MFVVPQAEAYSYVFGDLIRDCVIILSIALVDDFRRTFEGKQQKKENHGRGLVIYLASSLFLTPRE